MPRLRVLTSAPIKKIVRRWTGIPGYWNGHVWVLELENGVLPKPEPRPPRKLVFHTTRKVIEADIKRSVALGMKMTEQRITPSVEKEIMKVYGKTTGLVKKLKGYYNTHLS
jgi:hypothetical protein